MSYQKTVVITGKAGGMGLATARLVGRDHHVVIADLDQGRLDAAAAQLAEAGVEADTAGALRYWLARSQLWATSWGHESR